MSSGKTMKCAQCRRELDYSSDVIEVLQGVIGNKGVVPLNEPLRFCSEECLREYFDYETGNLPSYPKRIP